MFIKNHNQQEILEIKVRVDRCVHPFLMGFYVKKDIDKIYDS